jgi:hypothetical protein
MAVCLGICELVATVPRRGIGYTPTSVTPSLSPAGAFTPPTPIDFGPAAHEIARQVEEHQQSVDNMALLDADNQLSQLSSQFQQQVLSKQGKDAIGAGADVQDQWTKAVSDIGGGLNNRIQDQFRARADHHFSILNETVQNHARVETQKYDTETTDSFLQNRLNDAITHYTDPSIIGQSLAESRDVIDRYAERNGWSPEQTREKRLDATSKIHTGVIDRMLTDGNDLTATKYFNDHKGELTGRDSLAVQKALDVGSRRGESQRQADRILATTTNLADAIAAARAITDPETRDLTESRVRSDYIEKQAALRDAREQAMNGAANIVERTHSFDAIPPSLIAAMTVDERKSLRSYAQELQGGGAVKTDLGIYYNLETMATTPETRDKFLQLDLNLYRSKLSASDFEEMAKLQGQVRKGEDKPLKQLYTNQQIVTGVLTQARIGMTRSGKVTDKGLIAEFRDAVRQQTEQFEAEHGRLPTAAETKTIANELATQHVVERPGWLWGTNNENVRTFQMMQGEQILEMTIKDVPAQAQQQIRAALQNRNLPITNQAIVDEYRRHVQTLPPEP